MLMRQIAHTIRSRRTKLFKAVTSIDAAHHWCLTGTPISNKVDDLGALLEFCRVPLLGDRQCFQQHVVTPSRKNLRRGYTVLRLILGSLCLRRTRDLLDILQPYLSQSEVAFSKSESVQYKSIIKRVRRDIDVAVSGHSNKTSQQIMPKALLELRIFCNQGTFTPKLQSGEEAELDAEEQLSLLQQTDDAICVKCATIISTVTVSDQVEIFESGIVGKCSHPLCSLCYADAVDDPLTNETYTCPLCKQVTVPQALPNNSSLDNTAVPADSRHSSKISMLIEDLLSSQNVSVPEKRYVNCNVEQHMSLTFTASVSYFLSGQKL
jgi:SNF2 family DNA or RNA helicase